MVLLPISGAGQRKVLCSVGPLGWAGVKPWTKNISVRRRHSWESSSLNTMRLSSSMFGVSCNNLDVLRSRGLKLVLAAMEVKSCTGTYTIWKKETEMAKSLKVRDYLCLGPKRIQIFLSVPITWRSKQNYLFERCSIMQSMRNIGQIIFIKLLRKLKIEFCGEFC
jgi:hypothetical protein